MLLDHINSMQLRHCSKQEPLDAMKINGNHKIQSARTLTHQERLYSKQEPLDAMKINGNHKI
jgi:hypothetical protein